MPPACKLKSADLKVARNQLDSLLKQAKQVVGKQPQCRVKLETAEQAAAAAAALSGIEQRNGYVRASYHAGQAIACATVASIKALPKKPERKPSSKPKKPKKPRVRKPKLPQQEPMS